MAEIIQDSNWSSKSHYPWDEWLDGQPRRLIRLEDFKVSAISIVSTAHNVAASRHKKVRTRRGTRPDGTEWVIIQAYDEEGP